MWFYRVCVYCGLPSKIFKSTGFSSVNSLHTAAWKISLPTFFSRHLWYMLCQKWLLNKSMQGQSGHRASYLLAGMCSAWNPHVSNIMLLPRVHSTEWNHKHKNLDHPKSVFIVLYKSYSVPQKPQTSSCSPILHLIPKKIWGPQIVSLAIIWHTSMKWNWGKCAFFLLTISINQFLATPLQTLFLTLFFTPGVD